MAKPCWPACASSRRRWCRARTRTWASGAAAVLNAQILSDLGLGKLRVLGTPRRQVGLAGYGLEVVETVTL